ncbi:MAG TPA: 2-dehydropantoate 2-reductase, partial [Verrucomicrobiales bacterium]|nr:2-dehydropantoate 2-reductase [Verrucomicrobiales bacterium]
MKNIGVFGVGGVGGFFGGKLCQNKNEETRVTFFARGEHLKRIRENGLVLKTEKDGEELCRPDLATDTLDSIPELDFCILCVKGFDLIPLLSQLKDHVSENTVLLPLLNGADIHSRIRAVINDGIVLPACVYVGTHIEKPGVVSQRGGACKILFGPDPNRSDFKPDSLLELLRQADILHEWRTDVQTCIWEKFTFIASFGIVTAAHGKVIGEVLENESLRREVSSVIGEIISIADKAGVSLPDNMAEAAISKGATFPYETKTSFQRDFEIESKADERDLFAGAILRYAKEFGLEAPKTRALLNKLEEIKPDTKKAGEATDCSR